MALIKMDKKRGLDDLRGIIEEHSTNHLTLDLINVI